MINYYIDNVLVASVTAKGNIIPGETIVINFDETKLINVGGNWNEMKWNLGNWS